MIAVVVFGVFALCIHFVFKDMAKAIALEIDIAALETDLRDARARQKEQELEALRARVVALEQQAESRQPQHKDPP